MEILKILNVVVFICAFGLTAKAIYHMYHVVMNVTGKHASFLGPLILIMPNQFNEIGNKHRVALGPVLLGVMACWAVLFFTGALSI